METRGASLHSLPPCTLGPLNQGYRWEQLWKLEKHFKMESYPDLEAQRVLATRLNLKKGQVETWFIQCSLKQEMCPCFVWLWESGRHDPSSCVSHKASCYQPPSWRFWIIPINSSESSTCCEHTCWFCRPEFVVPQGHSNIQSKPPWWLLASPNSPKMLEAF